jgi:transposase
MKKMVFFGDNAKPHHSALVKDIFTLNQAYFVFNAPSSSKLNQIENVFELLKRPVRRKMTKNWKESILDEAFELLQLIQRSNLQFQTHKWLVAVDQALCLQRMW